MAANVLGEGVIPGTTCNISTENWRAGASSATEDVQGQPGLNETLSQKKVGKGLEGRREQRGRERKASKRPAQNPHA